MTVFEFITTTAFEIAFVAFLIWGTVNQKKLIAFEGRIAERFKTLFK